MKFTPIAGGACALALLSSAIMPAPAAGQAWIGQIVGDMMAQQAAYEAERQCMIGTPMVAEEVTEARKPALAAMTRYWTAVQPGGSGDASAAFHLDKKTRWTHGTTALAMAGMTKVSDNLALAGGVLPSEPEAFFRAGDGQSARAQWVVRTAGGKRVGTYDALFTRKAGDWRLSELTLTDAAIWVDPLVQYCHKVGDVLPYRVNSAAGSLAHAQKQLTKAEAKLAKAEAAAAKPKATPELIAKAAKARETLAEREARLQQMMAEDAAVKADVAAADTARAAGRAALAAELGTAP